MAQEQQNESNIAKLEADNTPKSDNAFVDAVKRLLRNRLAVIGLTIIVLTLLVSLFADPIARALGPYGDEEVPYAAQNLQLNNAAPQWIIDLFPVMKALDQNVNAIGATIMVETGDAVEVGDLIAEFPSADRNVYAKIAGTAYIQNVFVIIATSEPQIIEIPDDAEVLVSPAEIAAGTPLLRVDGEDVIADRDGFAYVTDQRVVVRPDAGGFVQVSEQFPVGADPLGRDLLTRIIYGTQVSLAVALIGPVFAIVIGLTLGLIAGYFGGWVDSLIMRLVDVVYAFPALLLIILLMAFFRSDAFATPEMEGTIGNLFYQMDRDTGGLLFIFIGIGFTSWLGLARLTRGQVLSVREQEYILAARAMGANNSSIMWKHVLPNILGPIIVAETLTIPAYIRSEAFLSFIGLGVNPPTASWGQMISDGAASVGSYPNQAIFPALALFIVMFAFNFLGDGLRDALDPRMRGND